MTPFNQPHAQQHAMFRRAGGGERGVLLLLRSALSSDLSRPDGAGGVVLLSSSHAKRHSALSRRPQTPLLPRVRRLQGRLRLPPRSLALLLLLLFTLDLLYDHATLADEQLYLLITVLLSFSQVSSLPPPHPRMPPSHTVCSHFQPRRKTSPSSPSEATLTRGRSAASSSSSSSASSPPTSTTPTCRPLPCLTPRTSTFSPPSWR